VAWSPPASELRLRWRRRVAGVRLTDAAPAGASHLPEAHCRVLWWCTKHRQVEDVPAALRRLLLELESWPIAPGAQGLSHRLCRLPAARAAIAADNQLPAWCHNMLQKSLDELALAPGPCVTKLCPDEVEAVRRVPRHRLAKKDAIPPFGRRLRQGLPAWGRSPARRARSSESTSARPTPSGSRWHSQRRERCRRGRSPSRPVAAPPPSVARRPRNPTARGDSIHAGSAIRRLRGPFC